MRGEVDDADDVTLTCGAASFSLVTLPLGEYPRLPELPRLAGTVDGGALATAISQVTPAASRDDTLPVITGVNVEIAGDTITLVATDRYRLAIRELGWDPARSDVSSTLLVPAKVSDRSDPQIVHLDGLNLSRAWCMRSIAAALPKDDPARKVLAESAARHAAAALPHVASGDYAGEHWLASFAVYMLATPAPD